MTTTTNTKQIRQTLISLLDDEHGIAEQGYISLRESAIDLIGNDADDIFNMVDSSNGRYYLPEDHNLEA